MHGMIMNMLPATAVTTMTTNNIITASKQRRIVLVKPGYVIKLEASDHLAKQADGREKKFDEAFNWCLS
jgi:hypothetical protein